MDFKILRMMSVCTSANSVSTRLRSEMIKKKCVCLPKNVGCIPLAVVIMTTANGIIPTFSGRHTQLSVQNLSFKYFLYFVTKSYAVTICSSCLEEIILPNGHTSGLGDI